MGPHEMSQGLLVRETNRHWITEEEANLPCQNERNLPPSWKALGEHEKKMTRPMVSPLLDRLEKRQQL